MRRSMSRDMAHSGVPPYWPKWLMGIARDELLLPHVEALSEHLLSDDGFLYLRTIGRCGR